MVPCNVQQFSNCAILLLSFKLPDKKKSFYRRHKSKQVDKKYLFFKFFYEQIFE